MITSDEILRMAREAGFSVRGETIRTMHSSGAWVGINDELAEFAALAITRHLAHSPPPPLVVSMSDVDQAQLAAMLDKRQPMPLVAALDTERAARIAAQVENEALKAERARSGLAHRKAVQEAVREAEDAAKLATATACANVCADMAQQLRGHGDVAGAEIAEALRDTIRARGAS